jgi:Fur family peroxide stress response transcriptional regulator
VTTENLSTYLKAKGIRPSLQRINIYNYLRHTKMHPTVEDIYKALSPDMPTLSKTTIYNTLHLFQEKGIVNVVKIDDHEARYDWDTRFHGHFKCTECGHLSDFYFDEDSIQLQAIQMHQIVESHMYFKGTCNTCLTQ